MSSIPELRERRQEGTQLRRKQNREKFYRDQRIKIWDKDKVDDETLRGLLDQNLQIEEDRRIYLIAEQILFLKFVPEDIQIPILAKLSQVQYDLAPNLLIHTMAVVCHISDFISTKIWTYTDIQYFLSLKVGKKNEIARMDILGNTMTKNMAEYLEQNEFISKIKPSRDSEWLESLTYLAATMLRALPDASSAMTVITENMTSANIIILKNCLYGIRYACGQDVQSTHRDVITHIIAIVAAQIRSPIPNVHKLALETLSVMVQSYQDNYVQSHSTLLDMLGVGTEQIVVMHILGNMVLTDSVLASKVVHHRSWEQAVNCVSLSTPETTKEALWLIRGVTSHLSYEWLSLVLAVDLLDKVGDVICLPDPEIASWGLTIFHYWLRLGEMAQLLEYYNDNPVWLILKNNGALDKIEKLQMEQNEVIHKLASGLLREHFQATER